MGGSRQQDAVGGDRFANKARRAKVTRTGFIAVIAWASFLCASVWAAPDDSGAAPQATANAQVQAVGSDESRLSKLAHRIADGKTTPSNIDTGNEDPEASAEASAPAGTPLVTGTPIIRPGSLANQTGEPAERPGSTSWIMKTLTSLGVVIGIALFIRWGYIRMGGKVAAGSSPVVEVLSRTAVAPRSHVMLLRVGGRVLVVSDSSSGMRTLASLEDAEEVADILGAVSATKPNSISRGFGQLLNRFNEDHDREPGDLAAVSAPAESDDASPSSVSSLLSRVKAMGRQGGAT